MKHFSDRELVEAFEGLVVKEKRITSEVVAHLREVMGRKLFGRFTSAFAYLTDGLGYSNASAQRRIDAARMAEAVPGLVEDLASGEINLSQVSVLADGFRRAEVSDEEKRAIVEKVKGEEVRATQVLVAEALNIPVQKVEKARAQADESVRLEITFTKEQMEVLQQVKEMISHSHPNPTWAELIVLAAQEMLKKHPATPRNFRSEYSVQHIRQKVFTRDKCCQWEDPATGKKCESRFQLEVDHIQPKWAGGEYTLENLQLLCAFHNKLKYERCG